MGKLTFVFERWKMTNNLKKLPFTQLMVSIMPKKTGIYTLWNQKGNVIYLGTADQPKSLFAELKLHFDNKHPLAINEIYDFQVEVCSDPEKQQIQFLKKYEEQHGRLPNFNKEIPSPKMRGE